MGRTLRRAAAVSVALSITIGSAGVARAALTDAQRTRRAIGYLKTQQRADGSIPAFSPIGSTADALFAIVAAGVGKGVMRRAIGFLRDQAADGNVNTIGLRAKVAIAAAAAGRNPRSFAGHNLVREIRSKARAGGRFGTAPVFDDALAVLALEAVEATLPANATAWLLSAQCPDGGWAYDEPYDAANDDGHCVSGTNDFFGSDTNTTSYVVQALEEANEAGWTVNPFAFFRTARDRAHGGWAYSPAYLVTDANSTALVLQVYAAAGIAPPDGSRRALRRLQFPGCGAWAYSWSGEVRTDPDPGATIGAVPGLLLRALPFTGTVTRTVRATPAC